MTHAFDGFRTLKFIHYIRDNKYSSIPINKLKDGQALNAFSLTEKYACSFNTE